MKYKSIPVYDFKENVDLLVKLGYSLEAIAAGAEVSTETIRQIRKGLKERIHSDTQKRLQLMADKHLKK
jgi:hypothetical protein